VTGHLNKTDDLMGIAFTAIARLPVNWLFSRLAAFDNLEIPDEPNSFTPTSEAETLLESV
jgi:hypothetical protein